MFSAWVSTNKYLLASDSHDFLIVYHLLIMIVIFPTDITLCFILDAVMPNTSDEAMASIHYIMVGVLNIDRN